MRTAGVAFTIVSDHMLVPDQDHPDIVPAGHFDRRFQRDFGADSVRIADRQRYRLAAAHSGNASNVSKRELSQTTIRSRIFGAPPFRR